MSDITDVFAIWPTLPEMAADIGAGADGHWMVRKWKQRKRIPNEWWPALIGAAKNRGVVITASDLLAMHTAPPVSQQCAAESHPVGG
jgi:hypothetical protein